MPSAYPVITVPGVRLAAKSLLPLGAAILGGCAAPLPPAAVTEAERAERVVYACPGKRTLEFTRVQDGRYAIVVADGRTLQLPRASHPAAERYSNGPYDLVMLGDSATLESPGLILVCSIGRPRDRD